MKIINHIHIVLLTMISCSSQAATYRWVDDKGEVHYSFSVPASNAQRGHIEMNKSGMKSKVVLSAKEKKEIKLNAELEEKRRIENKKLKLFIEQQEEEDIRLLSIFNTEEEVVKSYNAKLRMAQLTIDLLKSRHKSQSSKLESLETRFERSKDIHQKQAIEKKMDDILDNLRIYQQAITENHIEKQKVREDFQETLDRYKDLVTRRNTSENVNK